MQNKTITESKKLDMLFVQNYYEQMLGIMQISAVLKQNGFTTDVILGTKEDIVKKILAKKPRVVGFYCTTGFHHKNLAIAKEIKKMLGDEILTVVGGPHPTFVPSAIEAAGVDIICRGEGEQAVLELMKALRDNKDYTNIKNLTIKKEGKIYENEINTLCNLDALPFADREIYKNIEYIYKNKRYEAMLSRGCPFNCTFCSAAAFRKIYEGKGDYTRFRSVPNVIKELRDIKKRYQPTCFFFHDDTFVFKRNYLYEFLMAYKKEINIPFACLIRADLATDETVKLLKDAGCYLISFGIESGNENIRNTVLKKNLSNEKILKCAEVLRKYKIPFATFNMVGLPDENLKETWDTVDINVKAKPNWAWFSVYQTLPHTELARYALEKKYLGEVDVAETDSSFHENSLILKNHSEGKKMLRLKNMANLIIKIPILKPVVRIALSLPFDSIYSLIDKLLYFVFYYSKLTYKSGLLDRIHSAFFIARHMKEFK